MNDLGGPLSRDDSDVKLDRYLKAWGCHGYGRWLVELIRKAWGHGYATEAARAALTDLFQRGRLKEVLAYTDAYSDRLGTWRGLVWRTP